MHYRQLGHSDIKVSVLGLGLTELGIDQNGVLVTTDQHRRHGKNRRQIGRASCRERV